MGPLGRDLTFFKKSKNVLVAFILATVALSVVLIGDIENALGSGAM